MPPSWWLMASHEPAPVLLPSLWEGGRERVMAPGGRSTEREKKQKDRERVSRVKGGRDDALIQDGE